MCQTTLYKDTHCKHRWMRITTPCFPGAGFTTCPSFSFNNTHTHNNYLYDHHQSPDGLCHQPLCPYQQHPHPNHYTPNHTSPFSPPFSPTLTPSIQAQGQGQLQIQGHNTCHINLPTYPYHQIQHNCPHHQQLVAKPAPPAYIARAEPCPECDLRGVYDRNQVRMVTKIKKGVKLGGGPSGGDPGVEVRCCVM
ncbi:hypothetical protein B0H65DRAFT_585518 [Neurospora tetraspora]|uniref:Uncharacterized protein n=1 Tax=Neurospora tetraspora TaxID=94610 RepID=A0AAE0JQG3_9PEZI|nr:hypothetical protein B0H65DRAFT_585518 [Neurospora tetraspora]